MFLKNLYQLVLLVACSLMNRSAAQLPPVQWSNRYGGSAVDIPFTIKACPDGGTILAGYTDSRDGDVHTSPGREYWDLWVVKLNACGTIAWEKSLGGSNYESARDVLVLADGTFIIAGETNSTDGDVPPGFGGTKDIWLLRLDAMGNVSWQKRYGGSGLDISNRLCLLPDGNILLVASSSSNDGQVSGNHGTGGYTDAVLMKLDLQGNLLWSRCYGGSRNDELLDVEVINGRIYLAGYANSIDGDIPPQQKNYDVWLLAVDANGNKIYSKIFGGSQNDVAYAMTKGMDEQLVLCGYTTSSDGDVQGAHGSQDYWVLSINPATGKLNWQRVLGGSDAEYANDIITDANGGYLIGGISWSSDGDITAARGEGDYWLVQLDRWGNVVGSENRGGSGNDHLRALLYVPLRKEFYLCGDTDSDDGDFNTGPGETDFGIIKFRKIDTLLRDTAVCRLSDFISITDTLRDACGADTLYLQYRPVPINSPFENTRKTDTIFVGESIRLPSFANGTITWDADPTLSCTDCPHPVATPRETTTYTAANTLEGGCRRSDRFTVVVLKDALVILPSAFTPNDDGKNDHFGPVGKVPGEYTMQVYDRNGELVFKSNSTYRHWDGRYRGTLQPVGVYIYLVQYRDAQNKLCQQKGTVTLIR